MKTIVTYIMNISIALIILTFLEGLCTLGQAFKFEQYNWLGFLFQGLVVIATLCAAILITEEDLAKDKSPLRENKPC